MQPDDQPGSPSATSISPLESDTTLDLSYANLAREDGSLLWSRLTPVNGIMNGFDFTYDFRNQVLYWLEHNATASAYDISRVKFDGESREHLNADASTSSSAYCIEFDAASRNLFIGNVVESMIEVCKSLQIIYFILLISKPKAMKKKTEMKTNPY